jgi:chemotaxis protein CheD
VDRNELIKHLQESAGFELPLVYLQLGQCIVTTRKVIISTVLGSCVGATFFDRDTGCSAMFHSMLPVFSANTRGDARICNYVDSAIESIVQRYRGRGIDPAKLQVSLYGGGYTMNRGADASNALLDVGGKNVETARRVLRSLGLGIRHEDVQGGFGRKVFFSTATGESLCYPMGL